MADLIFNPYVGPRAFEEKEYRQFFGRDDEIRQLTSLVISHKVVLFYAPSGAGKTSIIKAGIIPRLNERKRIQVFPVTRLGGGLPSRTEESFEGNVYVFNTLVNLMGKDAYESELMGLSLLKGLESQFNGEKEQRTPPPRLLIIDQFEELFTTHPDRYEDRGNFFFQLQQCLDHYPRLSLLLVMREDFIAHLDYYASQVYDRLRTRFRMELLNEKNALEAVKRPAERGDRKFDNTVAEKLVDNLRRLQTGGKRGIVSSTETVLGKYVEPVHLQIVCRQLWDSLKPGSTLIKNEDVQEFGDVDLALRSYYQSAIRKVVNNTGLPANLIRFWIDDRLITQDRTRNMVYRGEIETNGLPNEAVDILNDTYLIRAVPRGNNTWYELAHDRLISPILNDNENWREAHLSILQRQTALWVKENKTDGLLLKGKALKDAEHWAENHPNEIMEGSIEEEFLKKCLKARKTERLFHVVFGLCVCLTIILILALGFIFYYSKVADRQKRIAEKQSRIADSRRLATEANAYRANYPQRSLLLAVEALWVTAEAGEYRVAAAEQALRESLSTSGGKGFSGHMGKITDVAISAAGRWLVTGSDDNTARLWDLKTDDPAAAPKVLTGHAGPIWTVAISADSRWLVTGSHDGTARLWDLKADDPAAEPVVLMGHKGAIASVAISADSRWLVTRSSDGTTRLWDLKTEDPAAAPKVFNTYKEAIGVVAISADSRWLVAGNRDNTVWLWDLKVDYPELYPKVYAGKSLKGPIWAVSISADSRWLVIGSRDKNARLWDLKNDDPGAKPILLQGHMDSIRAVFISADSRWLVTGSDDGTARLWDLKAEDPAAASKVLTGHLGSIWVARISADSRWLITGSGDQTVGIWDLEADDPAAEPRVLRGHEDLINSASISADSRWLVTGSWDGTARLWDLKADNPVVEPKVLIGHKHSISSVAISTDSRWVITGSLDGTARLWHLNANEPAAKPIVLHSYDGSIEKISISADNRWLVAISRDIKSKSYDTTLQLWDLKAENPAAEPIALIGYEGDIEAVAISSDSRWVITGSWDGTAQLLDLKADDPSAAPKILTGHEGSIWAVAISADNQWAVTGREDGTAQLWDLKADDPSAEPAVLLGHEDGIASVSISADSRWVVTGSEDNTARLWNLKSDDPSVKPIVLHGHKGSIGAIAISADSRWLVTGSLDKTARIWDLKSDDPSAEPIVLRGHEDGITSLSISADSRWIVTISFDLKSDLVGHDKMAWVWDLKSDDPAVKPKVLHGHDAAITAVTISANSQWLVTGSEDNTARIWDLKADDPAAAPVVLHGHEGDIETVAISADNRWLVTGSWDGTARLWHLKLDELVEIACRTAGRSLTQQEWRLYIGDKPYRETCASENVAELSAALKKISNP